MKETQIEQMLAQLRVKLLIMCAETDLALDAACESLRLGDKDKAMSVVVGDTAINNLENEIDELALSILARTQPVAQDLRFVVAALRMVIELERIGDEAANIAEYCLHLDGQFPDPIRVALLPVLLTALELYRSAVDIFSSSDSDRALALCRSGDRASRLELNSLHGIMDYLNTDSHNVGDRPARAAMNGILALHALHRICRRAVNIGEHVYFIAKGLNIKHSLNAG
ncbi:MAG: phosphate signaling complex protein PhoU [Deltaproteobacteria bacterium]|jgi:phosphate transport system protein|nr:phosphate signaling complex protein PhoU [Deltaproteobacteria bacterium]